MKFFKSIQQYKHADILLISVSLFLAYGLLIPFLHYYIDDWYWTWTWNTFGHPGITEYYSKIRPSLGLIFQFTTPILSIHPIIAHVFAFSIRLISTLIFYFLLNKIWHDCNKENLYTALVFGLYPGFSVQSIAMTYSHIFLILSIFLLSLIATINWIQTKKYQYLIISLLFSFINVMTLEYFFTLEFIRLIIIMKFMNKKGKALFSNFKKAFILFLPYIGIIVLAVFLRTTVLSQIQTQRYPIYFLSNIKSDPVNTILSLFQTIGKDIYITTIGAWEPAFMRLFSLHLLNKTNLLTLIISMTYGLFVALFFHFKSNDEIKNENVSSKHEKIIFGISSLLFAGWPFWLTNLNVTPYHLLSRYTLPFLFGASILIGCIFSFVVNKKMLSILFIIVSIFPSMYYQIQTMNDFRVEWNQNRELMWEMKWRIPDMQENTLVLVTDYPNQYYDVASLATELAVLYPKEPVEFSLPYFMLYSRNIDELNEGGLQKGIPINMHNMTAEFNGSTSQMIAIDYDPGKCVRVLDPDLDGMDRHLHEHVQKAAQISDLSLIDLNYQSDGSEMHYFGKEPVNSWCYFFEKADLAKQKQDWAEVINLYDQASAQGFGFKSERERYPFIEAYAQLGRWEEAYALIADSDQSEMALGICSLMNRVEKTTPNSDEKNEFLFQVADLLKCQ